MNEEQGNSKEIKVGDEFSSSGADQLTGAHQQSSERREAGTEFSPDSSIDISGADRLRLVRQVLFYLAIICTGVFIAYGRYPDNTALQAMFELIKIGALPLVTLVISFYFPSATR